MKNRILIVGAGFAGLWAALSAARLASQENAANVEIQVLAPQPELRVRPRFYEEGVAGHIASLGALFKATGVTYLQGEATNIGTDSKCVWYRDSQGQRLAAEYDRLVLATGSHLKHADVPGLKNHAFDLDQLESALALEQHINRLAEREASESRNTIVVCGGGFTGIEVALELPARLKTLFGENTPVRVIIVDRSTIPGAQYSEELQQVIAQASRELGVEWLLNEEVESIDPEGASLKDGRRINSHTVIWTTGVQASPLTLQIQAQRDPQGRLHVDENLQVIGYPDIYAAGDVAMAATDTEGHHTLMSCQHAILLGKFAGHNVTASLLGTTPLPYRQLNYVTCLDLGSWGAVYTEGWNQVVKSIGAEAKKIKVAITSKLIYPPEAEREKAFTLADPLAPFV